MFHQANVIPTEVPGWTADGTTTTMEESSILLYWYRIILEELSKYINIKDAASAFPVRVTKLPVLLLYHGATLLQ